MVNKRKWPQSDMRNYRAKTKNNEIEETERDLTVGYRKQLPEGIQRQKSCY